MQTATTANANSQLELLSQNASKKLNKREKIDMNFSYLKVHEIFPKRIVPFQSLYWKFPFYSKFSYLNKFWIQNFPNLSINKKLVRRLRTQQLKNPKKKLLAFPTVWSFSVVNHLHYSYRFISYSHSLENITPLV